MRFLATDLLIDRLDRLSISRPKLREAYTRRLTALRGLVNDGQSKRLKGSPGLFESRLADDDRLLWRRGSWRGEDVIFLLTIGGHDHVFDEARRIDPGAWTEVSVAEDEEEEMPPWREVRPEKRPDRRRFWVLDDNGTPEELELTDDQELLVDEAGPLLVTGSAGSGKTTLLAHRAARQAKQGDGRILFVTFHPELAEFTESILGRLHGGEYASKIDVLSLRDLCARIWEKLRGAGVPWVDEDADRARLNQLLLTEKLDRVPREYILAEIRGALSGRWLSDGEPPTLDAYRKGVRDDLSFLADDERVRLHHVFTRLRKARRAAGEVDRLDAARELASESALPTWDALFIDEAQDFTQVELDLLARLVPDPGRWAIAADEMQVVHPSLFRWDRVRDIISLARDRRKEPFVKVDLHRIETNHRNPAPILALGHAILDWRSELCGTARQPPATAEAPGSLLPHVTSHPRGMLPVREVAAIAQRVPLTAVLCPTAELAEDVREAVRVHAPLFTRALDFASAKGLEFDVVIAWHPFEGPEADAFERVAAQGAAAKVPTGVVELSVNRFYVAVTRSKRAFFAIDEVEPHRTWSLHGIRDTIKKVGSATDLVRVTSEEFAEARAEQWADAARSFARVGAWEQEAECWVSAGELAMAARIWEDHDRLDPAADAWERAGNDEGASRCRAILAERVRHWKEAAALWLRAQDLDRWRVAAAWAALEDQEPVQAARLFEEAGLREEAVDAWERAEIWVEALRVADNAGRPDWRARLLERTHQYAEAARAWITANRPVAAFDAALKAGDRVLVEDALARVLAAKEPTRAGLKEEDQRKKREEWEQEIRRVVEERKGRLPAYVRIIVAERIGDPVMRAIALHEDGRHVEAMEIVVDLEKSGRPKDTRTALQLQWRWARTTATINATEIARQALRVEIRYAIDGHEDKEALERAMRWAKQRELPVDKPDDLIALARRYREACKDNGIDRERLRSEAHRISHPVARGIGLALDGDVAAARPLWKAEGLSLLGTLNPMRVDPHLANLRREYILGHALGDEPRRRLRENLELLYKVCRERNAAVVGGMLAELTGDPGRAWSMLREKDVDIAKVRHETPRERRQRMERLLANGASMGLGAVQQAVLLARAYVASDAQDTLSAAALGVWLADDYDKALTTLAKEHRGEVSLPLSFELVDRVLTRGTDTSPLGPTWWTLGGRTHPKVPEGVPYRVLLERVLNNASRDTNVPLPIGSGGIDLTEALNQEIFEVVLPMFPAKGRADAKMQARWRRILDAYLALDAPALVLALLAAYRSSLEGAPPPWLRTELTRVGLRELAKRWDGPTSAIHRL